MDPLQAEMVLAAMAQCIISAPGEIEAQREQLGLVQVLTRSRSCYLLQYAELSGQLHVAAVRGRNDARIAAVRPGEGVAGMAFSERQIVRAEGVVGVPLFGAGIAVGSLVLLSPRRLAQDPLLHALGSQISAASEVARLKDEMVRRNRDLQTAVAGLKALEKKRELLVTNVSHDLKTPLSTLKVYLSLLGKRNLGELNEKQSKAIGNCERSADRLLRMITDLLLLSRLKSGKMQLNERPFGLKELAQNVVDLMAAPAAVAKINLNLLPSPEVFVRGDRDRLLEALCNLVDYAIQRSRGSVQISASSEKSGLTMLSVRDDGARIPPEDLEHLFDLYHRERGSPRAARNLGLPMAAKIVHLHGGQLEVKSSAESGTTFDLLLPAFAAAVAPASLHPSPRAGMILLVEDDVDCREVLQQVLDQEGYPVLSVADTAAAVSALRAARPAMVLLDLRLSREDGRSVLHYIRGTTSLSDVPVYVISGASDVSWRGSGKQLERIDGFFEKPINLTRLLGTVSAVVHRRTDAKAASGRTKA